MANRSVNHCTFIGNLGRDAETKFTQSGVAKTVFSIACGRRIKKGDEWVEETDWIPVVLWRSEKLAAYLTKGKQVYVDGRFSTRKYDKDGETRYMTEIVADNVILLGGADGGGKPTSHASAPVDDDDMVPF